MQIILRLVKNNKPDEGMDAGELDAGVVDSGVIEKNPHLKPILLSFGRF
jgi:hypothetical protein